MKTILVVDDEKVFLDSIAMALSLKSYRVVTASNGFDALNTIIKREFKGMPIDLLITDINMPHLSGLEIMDKLDSIKINLPVIATKTSKEEVLEIELLSRGCANLLEKPFAIDELITQVNALLEKEEPQCLARQP